MLIVLSDIDVKRTPDELLLDLDLLARVTISSNLFSDRSFPDLACTVTVLLPGSVSGAAASTPRQVWSPASLVTGAR
jgi:hypothetical protein